MSKINLKKLSKEDAIEFIKDFYGEEDIKVEDKVEDKKVEDKVEDKKEDIKVEVKKEEKIVVEDNQDVKDLVARVKQLEDQKIESDTKMQEWVKLANTLAKDKPFGIVNKVTKKEVTQTMYDKYDADLIIGK